MASKSSNGSALPEDIYMDLVKRMAVDYQLAKTDKDRQDVVRRSVKSLRALGINEALTKSFEQMAELGPQSLAKSMELVGNLAQNQASKRQDLEAERSKLLMQVMSQPEQTKASIASLVTGFATLARLFGANDLADLAQAKADEMMAGIKDKIQVDTGSVRSGSAEMGEALKAELTMLQGSNAAEIAAAAARKASESQGPDPYAPILQGGSAPSTAQDSGRQKLTWGQFKDNMRTFGLNNTEMLGLEKAFGSAASLSGDETALDKNERSSFYAAKGFKALPNDKQTKIKSYVEMSAEKGPA